MNQAHIHLLITHLSIFGSMFGGLVLAHGLWSKSNDTIIAAYHVFIISSLGAGIAYFTGEAAEETVEHLLGVVEATIKTHEESALYALVSLIILGASSIFGLFLTLKKSLLTRKAAYIILVIALVSFGLVARAGYLGGQIRHTEINSTNNSFQTLNETEIDYD